MSIFIMAGIAPAYAAVILFYKKKREPLSQTLQMIERFFINRTNLTLRMFDQGNGPDRIRNRINGFIAYIDTIITLIQIRAKQSEENAETLIGSLMRLTHRLRLYPLTLIDKNIPVRMRRAFLC